MEWLAGDTFVKNMFIILIGFLWNLGLTFLDCSSSKKLIGKYCYSEGSLLNYNKKLGEVENNCSIGKEEGS